LKRDFGAVTGFVTSPAQLRLERCQHSLTGRVDVAHTDAQARPAHNSAKRPNIDVLRESRCERVPERIDLEWANLR
jgi:hypothetical protein